MDDTYRTELKKNGQGPERAFHTCYAKHVAMVECCLAHHWPVESYLEVDHPYQRSLLAKLGEWTERNTSFVTVQDGCLLPTPVLTMSELANLYRKLSSSDEPPLIEARNAMMKSPEWIGGPGRLDTKLMKAFEGHLVAKEGADGLWGMGILPSARFPARVGNRNQVRLWLLT